MADLSFLPPIGGDAIEVDPLDLDNYQPPSETPLPLPVGNYLLRLIDGAIEKKDSDGVVEEVFPLLFDLTAKGYLKVTYSVAVIGRIERNPDKTETVTEEFQGRKLQYQRVNRTPFSKGPRIGKDNLTDMLYAFGYQGTLTGTTRAERNQSYADALEQCLGKTAKGRVIRRRGIDTGEVKDGRTVYKEFKNADFDAATGEVEFEGQMYTAYNEVDGWFRWSDPNDDIPF